MTTDAVSDRAVHPVAALFPMMSEEELAELAEDIRERGQLQPIVLGPDGEILDGRNRYAACKLAGVEPVFETYGGDDPAGYALTVNINRRHMRPGARFVVIEQARRLAGRENLAKGSEKVTKISFGKSSQVLLSNAAVVLDYAPDLVELIFSGGRNLQEAAKVARLRKQEAKEIAAKRTRLTEAAPDLGELVDEGRLNIDEAVASLDARETAARQEAERKAAEEKAAADEAARAEAEQAAARQQKRRTATLLLCKLIPALAEIDGEDLARRYDIDEQPADYHVTLDILTRAADTIDGIVAIWQERELP